MQKRFSCNATPGEFFNALKREGWRIFWERLLNGKQWRTDGVIYYLVENIPTMVKNKHGGWVIQYQIESREHHPDLEEYTDSQGNKVSTDMTRKHERSTTFDVQPVGSRIHVIAECGHEAERETLSNYSVS